jgi:hypothetical protein
MNPFPPSAGPTVRCIAWRPLRKNTLFGFCTVRVSEWHLEIRDIAVHQKGAARWAQLPARAQLDRDGVPIRDEVTGKIAYATVLDFLDWRWRNQFARLVIDALLAAVPDALTEERAA